MVPLVGLEPTTSSLPMMRNYQLCYSGFFGKFRFFLEMSRIFPCMLPEGARDPEGFNGALAPQRETATDEGVSFSFAPAPIRFDVCCSRVILFQMARVCYASPPASFALRPTSSEYGTRLLPHTGNHAHK